MRAGSLSTWVTLEEPVTTRSTDGGMVAGWAAVDSVWASVSDLRGREYLTAQEHHAEVTTRVVIRTRDDVVPSWRVVAGSRVLAIVHVIVISGGLELMCREVVE